LTTVTPANGVAVFSPSIAVEEWVPEIEVTEGRAVVVTVDATPEVVLP
jgi:hypothetical protein